MTNRMKSQAVAAGFFVAMAAVARGGDVYVVRFDTLRDAAFAQPTCTYLAWRDGLIFHNTSATEQAVSLLGVSNGPATANTQGLSIGAGMTKSSEGEMRRRQEPGLLIPSLSYGLLISTYRTMSSSGAAP